MGRKELDYYEIVMSNREIVVGFTLLLAFGLGSFFIGIRMGRESAPWPALGAIGALSTIVVTAILGWAMRAADRPVVSTGIDARVERLISSLSEAVGVIAEIEREVEARSVLAGKLQKDVEISQQLVGLDKGKVEAVVQTLRGEVSRSSRLSLLQSALLGLFFFMLGALSNMFLR